MDYRKESDLLGTVQVPLDALYGAQTQRALDNFPVGRQRTLGSFPTLVRALLQVKQAAAVTNQEIGALPPDKAQAIVNAAQQLLQQDPAAHFPIHALHGGGGTSANMNANEVLANLAEERLGGRRGAYHLIHPNDDLNLHQSTNDVYPTACRIAILLAWPEVDRALAGVIEAFEARRAALGDQRRIARTCLQDAVENSFSDLFEGYSGLLRRRRAGLARGVDALHAVNLGGTIIGRAGDVPEAYFQRILPALRRVTADPGYHRPESLFDAAQNPDELVAVSAQLELLARGLIKIANDLRLLASGPEAGLGEVTLPAAQPGSSIMPGKVNPVIPEFLIQIGFRVVGQHTTCAMAQDHGELDLNVWESAIVCSILESMELLEAGLTSFAANCIRGLDVDAAVNAQHAHTLIPLLTALAQKHGYARVTALCKAAGNDPDKLRALLRAEWDADLSP